jgi:hypothetical protein
MTLPVSASFFVWVSASTTGALNEAPRSSVCHPLPTLSALEAVPELPSPPACTAIQPTFSSPWMPSRRSASSTLSVKPPAVIAVGSLST